MGDTRVITPSECDVLLRADAGAIRFKVKIPLPGLGPAMSFTTPYKPYPTLYRIIIGRQTKLINLTHKEQNVTVFALSNMEFQQFQEFWVTWYNKTLRMGVGEERKPFLVHPLNPDMEIGYVQFNTMSNNWAPVEWIVSTAPIYLQQSLPRKMFDSKLQWCKLVDGELPPNALIGGFENEPTYIARANHNNSLCPGKFVRSTKLAYVPWGHREYPKKDFEILCGHNVEWVKTKSNYIPSNAYIAGRSEVQNDPLYIGRAMYDGKLLTGKVHIRYKSCYLPYNGKEICVGSYEILVIPGDEIKQAIPFDIEEKEGQPGRSRHSEQREPPRRQLGRPSWRRVLPR